MGPVAEQAEERHRREQTVHVLSAQRDHMFHALVGCAKTVAESLEIASPNLPAEANFDVAAYLTFFDELL